MFDFEALKSAARASATAVAIVAALAACGSSSTTSSATTSAKASKRPPVRTLSVTSPCSWLTTGEVEQVLGKLTAPPVAQRDMHSRPTEDAEYDAGGPCVYTVAAPNGRPVQAIVSVDPSGATGIEIASNMLGTVLSKDLLDGTGAGSAATQRTDGWDFVGGVGGANIWRIGHVAISFGGDANFLLPKQRLAQFATLIRDRLPDLPFANPAADPTIEGARWDPCELLTRTEAEGVLGALVVEPFRSAEGSPLADEQGSSCTYYTRGHHALVLTPTPWDGKGYYDLAAGTSSIMRSKLGGADAGDALDGPWDRASQGVSGSLLFLKDDQVVELSYQLSSTDIAGAAQLAGLALKHLQTWK